MAVTSLVLLLIAVSVHVDADGHVCSVAKRSDPAGVKTCLDKITADMKRDPVLTGVLPTQFTLKAYIDLELSTNSTVIKNTCCKDWPIEAETERVDPTDDDKYGPQMFRNTPDVNFVNFTGNTATYYVYMMIDPCASHPFCTRATPAIHWLAWNIPGGSSTPDITKATGSLGYVPSTQINKYFHWLLEGQQGLPSTFKHETYLPASTDAGYQTCVKHKFEQRCRYNISKLIEDFQLKLVAANWQQGKPDPYYVSVNGNAGRLNFTDACPKLVDKFCSIQTCRADGKVTCKPIAASDVTTISSSRVLLLLTVLVALVPSC